jgi:hypothetical protein
VRDRTFGAQFFVMIRDGAMAAGCLGSPEAVCEIFLRGVEAMLTYRPIADPTGEAAPARRKRRTAPAKAAIHAGS